MNFPQICDDNAAQLSEIHEPRADDWRSDEAPDGTRARVLASDRRGDYTLPFQVLFKSGAWINPSTREKLECRVVGWVEWKDRRMSR